MKDKEIEDIIEFLQKIKNGEIDIDNLFTSNKLSEISLKLDKLIEITEKFSRIFLISIKKNLNVEEAALYTTISKSEIYKKTMKKEIPHTKPVKQIFFKKEDLNDFMNKNPQ